MNPELMDEDNYPTEQALQKISEWQLPDLDRSMIEFFKYVRSLWVYDCWQERSYFNEDRNRWYTEYKISTMGWSGNESVIRAMMNNRLVWSLTWVQSRRGGHYIFEVPQFD
jgi:hypothetical protein